MITFKKLILPIILIVLLLSVSSSTCAQVMRIILGNVDGTIPPTPPLTRVGSVTLAVGEDWAYGIAISGTHTYISTGTHPARVVAVDISVPTAPVRVAGITLATGEGSVYDVAISGTHTYISTGTHPARVVAVTTF